MDNQSLKQIRRQSKHKSKLITRGFRWLEWGKEDGRVCAVVIISSSYDDCFRFGGSDGTEIQIKGHFMSVLTKQQSKLFLNWADS